MIQDRIFQTPIGNLHIKSENDVIISLEYGNFSLSNQKVSSTANNSPFWEEVQFQLNEYFQSGSVQFNLPCKLEGSEYQKRVWQALIDIPRGEVLTYGALAKNLHSHPRAIGMACRKNPIPLFIPCHRVVSASGIGGFAGQTQGERIALKKWLLQHESASVSVLKDEGIH